MCIVGIILVDFIEISIKSIKSILTVHNLDKISKLGREIIKISIISPVQTHILLYSARNKSKFRFVPSKWYFKQVSLQIGVPLAKFCQYLPSLHIFIIFLLPKSGGLCNNHGSKYIYFKLKAT